MSENKTGFRVALNEKERISVGHPFKRPDGSRWYIKRISTVEVKDGVVYVSGQCVEEGQR